MKSKLRLSFQKGDGFAVLIVVFLIVLAGVLFLPRGETKNGNVEIFRNGEKIHTFPLTETRTFSVEGEYKNVISIENGRVAITESDCPGTDCVRTGWISAAGRSIVCLPNRVEVRITSFDDVDFVVR